MCVLCKTFIQSYFAILNDILFFSVLSLFGLSFKFFWEIYCHTYFLRVKKIDEIKFTELVCQ